MARQKSFIKRLELENKAFNAELQRQIEGTLPKRHIYSLGMPSEALLYAGVENLPVEMAASTLEIKSSRDYVHDHPFGLFAIFNLPSAIQMPVAVFDTEEPSSSRKIILTEIQLAGSNFIAVLDLRNLSRNGRFVNRINSIISLYAKDSTVRVAKWFDSTNRRGLGLDRELCLWADTKKASAWLSSHSSDVNAAGLSAKRIAKVIQKFESVQFFEENNSLNSITNKRDKSIVTKKSIARKTVRKTASKAKTITARKRSNR